MISCVAAVVGVAACSSPAKPAASASADPYRADVLAARAKATSAFERQVLQDGVITRAEYQEATQRYVACMKTGGVNVTTILTSGGYYTYDAVGYDEKVDQRCSLGTNALIGPLYVDRLKNPTHGDFQALRVACFLRKGLAQPGYTLQQWKADRAAQKFPFSTEDPRFSACMENPSAP